MRTTKLIALLVTAAALTIVVLQNTAPVSVHFLSLSGDVPAAMLLFLTTAGGFVAGLLVAILVRSGVRL